VAELSRPRAPRVAHRNDALLRRIQALKAEHPCWGYRRIGASVRVVAQWAVHKKRGLRLMQAHPLVVLPNRTLKAKRTPTRSKPKATKPGAWWGIDMTKGLVEGFGGVSSVVVLDW
jgi:putative transposase